MNLIPFALRCGGEVVSKDASDEDGRGRDDSIPRNTDRVEAIEDSERRRGDDFGHTDISRGGRREGSVGLLVGEETQMRREL